MRIKIVFMALILVGMFGCTVPFDPSHKENIYVHFHNIKNDSYNKFMLNKRDSETVINLILSANKANAGGSMPIYCKMFRISFSGDNYWIFELNDGRIISGDFNPSDAKDIFDLISKYPEAN